MSFYVTLLSNDLRSEEFTKTINTLSEFVNTYSPSIILNGKWEVAVASLFCHNQYSTNKPDFLHVSTNLVLPLESQTNVICTIARPKAFQGKVGHVYYEPLIKEYYPVYMNQISSIKINVKPVNEDFSESEAKLLAGQPTIVKLHFQQQRMYSPDAVVRIYSKHTDNPGLANNKAYNFYAQLGRQYNFDPDSVDLEVALSSITYQPHFTIKAEQHLKIQQFDIKDNKKEIWSTTVKPFQGSTIQEYETYIQNDVLNQYKNAKDPVNLLVTVEEDVLGLKRFTLVTEKPCVIQFPYALMFNMGERNFIPKKGLSEKDATSNYSYKITLNNPNIGYKFQATPDPFAFYPDVGFLYCNFIQYNRIGNTSAPILRAFPISHKNEGINYTTYNCPSPEYFPVSKYDLSNLQFEIRDVAGEYLPFMNANSNVSITLFIRNRNKYIDYML